jgi:hypothetical protein
MDKMIVEYSLINAYKARILFISLETFKLISKKDKLVNIDHY